MTLQQQQRRGGNLIKEVAAIRSAEKFPSDVGCLQLWTKARMHSYGTDIVNNKEMQVLISMAIETAYRMGIADANKT